MRRILPPAIGLALTLGCSLFEDPPPPPAPPPPPPPAAPIVASRAIATRAAFDLVTGPAGTFLAWGVPAAEGGGVRIVELGPGGAARGTETDIARGSAAAPGAIEQAPTQVFELAAGTSGDHLAVAWSVIVLGELRAEAAYAATPPHFAAPVDLGAMEPGASGRGNLVVAALHDGELFVEHRTLVGPCHDATAGMAECSTFARTRIPEGDALRGDGPSEIPGPCAPLLAGSVGGGAGASDPWFYAVCHGGETPTTTMFVINPDPESQYAAAAELLAGCTPVSVARAENGAVLRARCGDDEAFARLDTQGRVTHELRHAVLEPRCEGGRPILAAHEGDVRVERPLTESDGRIEAWLPGSIAPDGSRAVWTGESVLVATPIGPEGSRAVSVRRFQCERAALVRTDR
ncbi:MAG: hypothetical protein U0234_05045 [Sandaracinus sp.]